MEIEVFPYLTLFPKHIRKLRIAGLNGRSTIFNCDLLIMNQHSNNCRNVNLPPAVRLLLEPILQIRHCSRKILIKLNLQILFYLCSCIPVWLSPRKILLITLKDLINICISISKLCDQSEVTVYMRNQIFQCLVNLALCIAALDLDMFAVHIKLCINNSFFQILCSSNFILSGLILLITDDILYGFRKLRHIPLFHVFTDLHGVFERLVIGILSEYLRLPVRKNPPSASVQLFLIGSVATVRMRSIIPPVKAPTACPSTIWSKENHISIAELLCGIDIRKDHLGNAVLRYPAVATGVFFISRWISCSSSVRKLYVSPVRPI